MFAPIVNVHIQAFIDNPNAKSHSTQELKAVRDKTCEMRSVLLNLNKLDKNRKI